MKKGLFVAAVLCGIFVSFEWPSENELAFSLGPSQAEARVGRPATATSVAGAARRGARRTVRRCAAGVYNC